MHGQRPFVRTTMYLPTFCTTTPISYTSTTSTTPCWSATLSRTSAKRRRPMPGQHTKRMSVSKVSFVNICDITIDYNSTQILDQYGNMPHLPGADSLFNQQNPFGGLNMPYSQMGNYGQYGYPNSAAMMNSFLSSMGTYGTTAAMEKEIAMLSQMYSSPYASLLANTARGGPPSNQYPYGSQFGSGILPSLSSSTGGPPPYTPTTSTSIGGPNFSLNPYNSSNSNLMASMGNYLPPFNQSPNSLPSLPSNMPGPSSSSPAASYRPLHQTSALRDIDKDVWSYLTSASNMYGKDDLLGGSSVGPMNFSSGSNVAPGPNAMKNPLLFKELSIPCAEPIPSGSTGLSLPSIPTSVITSVGSSKESPKAPMAPQPQTKPQPVPSSMPAMTTTTATTSANAVTATATVNKDLVRTVAAANPNRRSPLATKATATLLSPTQGPSSPAVITLSSTANGPQTSPEPHIIVKNVNAINQSVKPISTPTNKTAPISQPNSTKPLTQPVKNFNMGIVYPPNKKPAPSQFELNENNSILRAAQAQLNALTTTKGLNISNANNSKTTHPTMSTTTNLPAPQTDRVSVTTAPNSTSTPMNKNNRVFARSVPMNSSPIAGSSKVIRRPQATDAAVTKPVDTRSSIDPKRWTNQSGLTISPVSTTTPNTYKATPMKTTPGNTPGKANIYTMAAQNILKNNAKPSPISVSTIRQPAKNPTTNPTTLVRQNTAPTFTTGPARFNNVIQSTNNGTTIIRQPIQPKGRPVPPLVRQNTSPMISTHPTGTTVKTLTTSTPTAGAANTRPVMNRNVTVRRVNPNAAPGKATVTNTQFTPQPSTIGTSSMAGKQVRNNPPMSMVQRTGTPGNNPAAKQQTTTVRGGAVSTPHRTVAGLPMRQTPITTPVRTTTANGGDNVVRRIVIGSGGTPTAAGRPPGTMATNVVQQQQRMGVVRTTGPGPIVSTSAGTMSGTSGAATASAHKV